jgi:hypothetical protein
MTMALLLQCLRDVRTKAGDPDMIPPVNDCASRGDHHQGDGNESGADSQAQMSAASTFATHSQRASDEARH